MRRIFSISPEKINFLGPRLWLLIHLAIPLLLLLSVILYGPVRINTLLLDMLPESGRPDAVMQADMVLSEKAGRELVVYTAAPDFETAKKGAALLYSEFEHSPDFEEITLYIDSGADTGSGPGLIEEISSYLYNFRFVIAGSETAALLENNRAEEIAHDALASAFGVFNLTGLDNIENDPFLLTERRMLEFLSSPLLYSGRMSPREDVLAAEYDGNWHVMTRFTLAPGAASMQPEKNAAGKIYRTAQEIKESIQGIGFYFSGIPFHSYESSSAAQKEISLISTIVLITILFLFLYIFRSPVPVILSMAAAGISIGMASAAALLLFREIHIMTFVFGTTLIGTCVDYSVHFFVHWKGNKLLQSGHQIRSSISKSMVMSFVSTQICFFTFLFAPFPLLKQFAVFSMAGLLSSFLTSFCIYPLLKIPEEKKRRFRIFESKIFPGLKIPPPPQGLRTGLAAGLCVIVLTLFFINFSSVKTENDLSSIYTMSDYLLESEIRAAQVLGYSSPSWYFIVSGSGPEEILENEERLVMRLEEEIKQENLGAFLGTSLFVPSIKTQKNTYEAMKALLPLVPSQFEHLGFPPDYADNFYREFAAAENYCLPEHMPSIAGLRDLWIGNINENYFSCVLLINPENMEIFRNIGEEFDFVHFINKTQDISRDLDTLTRTMLFFFLAAYLVVCVVVFLSYPKKDSFKICAVPVFLVLSVITVLAVNKIPLTFFSVAALVLVFGLGLDYIFYLTVDKQEGKNNLRQLAVALSFTTTILSFGALALSKFVPAQIFGITVFSGLCAAFILTMLLQSRRD